MTFSWRMMTKVADIAPRGLSSKTDAGLQRAPVSWYDLNTVCLLLYRFPHTQHTPHHAPPPHAHTLHTQGV